MPKIVLILRFNADAEKHSGHFSQLTLDLIIALQGESWINRTMADYRGDLHKILTR